MGTPYIDRIARRSLDVVFIVSIGVVLGAPSINAETTVGTAPAKPTPLDVSPSVRFLTPTSAEFCWQANIAGPAALAYGPTRKLGSVVQSESVGTYHRVVIDNLQFGQDYWYRFGVRQQGKRLFSEIYQLEGHMNYTPSPIQASESVDGCQSVLAHLRQLGGYAVVVEGVDPSWAESVAAGTSMTVVLSTRNPNTQETLRRRWYAEGKYGTRLTVQQASDLPSTFANLVIVREEDFDAAIARLAPLGQVVKLGGVAQPDGFTWQRLRPDVMIGRRAEQPDLAAWGHQYGSAANASYSGERLGGVDNTADLEVKWIGKPGADFGIDRNPRMPAPLAVGGRLFHQGMNRMIAVDAFNGAVLWSLEIPDLRRVNIPRDSANWCADESNVYAAVKDRLWVIDAATGEMNRTMLLPSEHQDDCEWGYVAVTENLVVGTAVKQGSAYSTFWDKAAWYDGKDDAATAKVCGNSIAAYDKDYGSIQWEHHADAIVHSTITIQGDHVYFVQVDDPSLQDSETGKLVNSKIWHAASVVCLDLHSGKQLWKSKVPPQNHEAIISFGIADDQQFVLQTSGKRQFHFLSLDANGGRTRWDQSVDWPEDHHGAHVQHAVLMNGKLMVQPHILDASDGSIFKSGTLGKRRGCATPIGAGNSVIYRGGTGPLTLWSLENDSTSEFARLRPSCWLSTIPAQGMLFSPEGGGGCSCGGWMETSIGFAPVVEHGDFK
ncbi:Outer membrane protein assembly factor BamB [Stieleria maiorica]|uniref:Outer membrane protein assembly factor BamB n=1 Tax=Stieleria maiorica TaxID=2795974 RepID=A0A5B9MAL7_9BACT|nr:PQQ-binding-like beta-propeller repeat protein [Stieleria maiorica]QEF97110.1 Outer membrane protein assembly factor BamB [Stieleria maiorica]